MAFKLGTALRRVPASAPRLRRGPPDGVSLPAPLLGAAAALVFLFVEDNPIWGGTIASTLTGEFSYTYGIGLALLFLGCATCGPTAAARGRGPGRGCWPSPPSRTATRCCGRACRAGPTFLYRRPTRAAGRTLGWLLAVAAWPSRSPAFALVPLLADWGWTTPYDDPWIT